MRTKKINKLISALKSKDYSTESDVLTKHCIDWRGEYQGKSKLVIFPKSVKKISEILRTYSFDDFNNTTLQ